MILFSYLEQRVLWVGVERQVFFSQTSTRVPLALKYFCHPKSSTEYVTLESEITYTPPHKILVLIDAVVKDCIWNWMLCKIKVGVVIGSRGHNILKSITTSMNIHTLCIKSNHKPACITRKWTLQALKLPFRSFTLLYAFFVPLCIIYINKIKFKITTGLY